MTDEERGALERASGDECVLSADVATIIRLLARERLHQEDMYDLIDAAFAAPTADFNSGK